MIEKKQVQHIAKLARLRLADEEIAKYQQDLSQILDYFDTLQEADTKDIEPMTHSVRHENAAREDIPRKEQADVISRMMELAPAVKDGFLKVKEILKRET